MNARPGEKTTNGIVEIVEGANVASRGEPPEKAAETDYPIEDVIRRRWSPRAFSGRPVENEKLRSLFEAARWAASSSNLQPWIFIAATADDPVEHERMLEILKRGNRRWANQAPALVLAVASIERNDGTQSPTALYDLGLAVGNLLVQATALGLSVHQMAGFDHDAAREVYRIPEGHEPVAVIALGYGTDPALLPEDLRERETAPRSRKPQREFVFSGSWDSTWDESPGTRTTQTTTQSTR